MPKMFCSCGGMFSWSEKKIDDLSESDLKSIVSFCLNYGYSAGWHSYKRKKKPINQANLYPFDPAILNGEPYKKWTESFMRGVSHAEADQIN